ncbi:hypothetical protein C2S51_037353 [Perilla frutescens var. frutescens]|nr:hypothetical protein C2S51_037353 [Perilla frutescens var. frutescens]
MATSASAVLLLVLFIMIISVHVTVGEVGVCYGMLGDNLPSAEATVALYKQHNIKRMRLYAPHIPTLRALAGTDIRLMLGVSDTDLFELANFPAVATAWVCTNILRYPTVMFTDISVGNEIDPESELGPFVLPAMQNIYRAVRDAGLEAKIKVSTSIKTDLLRKSYPPQAGEFKCSLNWYIRPILEFLRDTDTSLLVNIYPFFAYINDRKNINLSFALLQPNSGVVIDGVYYDNLYYAMVDAVDAAIDKVLAASPALFSLGLKARRGNQNSKGSESNWPSAGGGKPSGAAEVGYTAGLDNDEEVTTIENARIYTNNLMRIVKHGTPRNPGRRLETYIFAMFDENQKPGPEYERHFGIFYPDGKPKYPLRFYD